MTARSLIDELHERLAWAIGGGGDRLRERHLARGKIPARDRIDLLLDPGSPFLELSALAGWGLYDNQVRQFLRPSSQMSHLKQMVALLNRGAGLGIALR